MSRKRTILVVDDEQEIRTQLRWSLKDDYNILEAENEEQALGRVRGETVDLVLLDLRFPPHTAEIVGGRQILQALRKIRPALPVIIMTGDQDRQTAVEMVARGAFDLFRKPIELGELRVIVKRALRIQRLETEVRQLRSRLDSSFGIESIVGKSPAIQEVVRLVRKVADTSATVLISGESGTGKELLARALHQLSSRSEAPFVGLNCASVPSSLIDDELFGHEKGAFTGAVTARRGKFEFAGGGTLFLDEVGDVPPNVQMKLLRVLQESEIQRLGGNASIPVDVRLVAATNQDLESKCRDGSFRKDLYYRLNVVRVTAPPLRTRAGDVPLLVEHFLAKHAVPGSPSAVSPQSLSALGRYDWPGNVRQLENMLNALCVTCDQDIIGWEHLAPEIRGTHPDADAPSRAIGDEAMDLAAVEKDLIRRALEQTGGNRTRAARLLGISRHVLQGKLKRHGLG